jgi:ATP-dependent Clp protease ATP-binding subunit ClpC
LSSNTKERFRNTEDPIAEEILKGELSEGDTMEVDYERRKPSL